MKNVTIDGVSFEIPIDAKLKKNSFDNYEDNELKIQFAIFEEDYAVFAANHALESDESMKEIDLDDIPSGAKAYESDANWINIFIVNKYSNRGIIVGAKDKTLAIKMINSVIFE